MIKGIGCDIVKISRIEEQIIKFGDKFLVRIFTIDEIKNAPDNVSKKTAYFAKRFAGKEAASKAIGTGIGKIVSFTDIEILNNESGAPTISIKGLEDSTVHISLSDEAEYAIAYCTITE